MTRLFDEHIVRPVKYLNGSWDFMTDPKREGEEKQYFKNLPAKEKITVPGVWNTEKDLLKYEGLAWYSKKFYFEGGTLRLNFGAVLTEAKVWLDGNYLGYHYGGFTQFDFIVNGVEAGEHTLTLSVDNLFDLQSIPQKWVDWYHYGGIIRDVTAEKLCGITALFNRFEYELSDDLSSAKGSFTVEIFNAENTEVTDIIKIDIDGSEVCRDTLTLGAYERKEIKLSEIELKNIKLWNIDEPNLTTLR